MSEKVASFNDQDWKRRAGLQAAGPGRFWASWCAPCRALVPTLDDVALKYEGRLRVGKINVEENADVPFRYSITALPTLLLFKDGKVASSASGSFQERLIKIIDSNLA